MRQLFAKRPFLITGKYAGGIQLPGFSPDHVPVVEAALGRFRIRRHGVLAVFVVPGVFQALQSVQIIVLRNKYFVTHKLFLRPFSLSSCNDSAHTDCARIPLYKVSRWNRIHGASVTFIEEQLYRIGVAHRHAHIKGDADVLPKVKNEVPSPAIVNLDAPCHG
jgi:hypothetical protein